MKHLPNISIFSCSLIRSPYKLNLDWSTCWTDDLFGRLYFVNGDLGSIQTSIKISFIIFFIIFFFILLMGFLHCWRWPVPQKVDDRSTWRSALGQCCCGLGWWFSLQGGSSRQWLIVAVDDDLFFRKIIITILVQNEPFFQHPWAISIPSREVCHNRVVAKVRTWPHVYLIWAACRMFSQIWDNGLQFWW